VRLGVRVLAGSAGLFALALTTSACSNNPSPSAPGNGSTTTTARILPPTSTSSSRAVTSSSTSTSTPTTAGHGGPPGPAPTLGVAAAWGASAVGFGQVKPAEISLGGDPTGLLTGITWASWGGSTATGTGTSTYVGPNQSTAQGVQETATVVASDLGTCAGVAAYQQVKWYFPEQGETLASGSTATINACSGP
jgi:hypothetical protein